MTENEHIDRVKQLAAKKELPILNEAEFLTFQLDKSDELEIDEDDIVAYIPITFDANKAFGLDVCEDTSNDDIYLTAEWCLGDGEYQKARRDMQEIVTIKANIDTLMGYTEPGRKQEKER